MELHVGGHIINKWNKCNVVLQYDGIASTFAFQVYFDPTNKLDKKTFNPSAFNKCEIYDNKILLITGVITSFSFNDTARPNLISISGTSKTGVLASSCSAPFTVKTNFGEYANGVTEFADLQLQFNNSSLKTIAEKLCLLYGIKVIVDETVEDECNEIYAQAAIKADEYIGSYLIKLAAQKHVILSHTKHGNLLLTKIKTVKAVTTTKDKTPTIIPFATEMQAVAEQNNLVDNTVMKNIAPIFKFNKSNCESITLNFDGDNMHSNIYVVGDSNLIDVNAKEAISKNPYCNRLSVKTIIQNAGDDNDSKKTARYFLGQDLLGIKIIIDIVGWNINGSLARPNQIITIQDENCHIYNATNFFIKEVSFSGDAENKTAKLTCVLPECFNEQEVKKVIFN